MEIALIIAVAIVLVVVLPVAIAACLFWKITKKMTEEEFK